MRRHRSYLAAALGVLVLAAGACGGGEEKTPKTSSPAASSVGVTLQEWAVLPAKASVPAGSVTFQVENKGPKHKHEFVVVKTDLVANALPTKADGSVNEEGAGVSALGEIEEFAVGGPQTKTFTMSPGKYVLFCNVVEETPTAEMGGIKAHYKLGMSAAFTVT
jgi:uncharacterized cupredoxin-like copper-binding protein